MDCAFLIVDADRNFREALAIALRLDGIVAETAASADDAAARLGRTPFGCCVVDAHLDGAEAFLRTASDAGLRVVLTGPYPDLLAVAALRHPRVEWLAKPFDVAALTRRCGGNVGGRPARCLSSA
jgi:DNA-binding NtrC family response regulator